MSPEAAFPAGKIGVHWGVHPTLGFQGKPHFAPSRPAECGNRWGPVACAVGAGRPLGVGLGRRQHSRRVWLIDGRLPSSVLTGGGRSRSGCPVSYGSATNAAGSGAQTHTLRAVSVVGTARFYKGETSRSFMLPEPPSPQLGVPSHRGILGAVRDLQAGGPRGGSRRGPAQGKPVRKRPPALRRGLVPAGHTPLLALARPSYWLLPAGAFPGPEIPCWWSQALL